MESTQLQFLTENPFVHTKNLNNSKQIVNNLYFATINKKTIALHSINRPGLARVPGTEARTLCLGSVSSMCALWGRLTLWAPVGERAPWEGFEKQTLSTPRKNLSANLLKRFRNLQTIV